MPSSPTSSTSSSSLPQDIDEIAPSPQTTSSSPPSPHNHNAYHPAADPYSPPDHVMSHPVVIADARKGPIRGNRRENITDQGVHGRDVMSGLVMAFGRGNDGTRLDPTQLTIPVDEALVPPQYTNYAYSASFPPPGHGPLHMFPPPPFSAHASLPRPSSSSVSTTTPVHPASIASNPKKRVPSGSPPGSASYRKRQTGVAEPPLVPVTLPEPPAPISRNGDNHTTCMAYVSPPPVEGIVAIDGGAE